MGATAASTAVKSKPGVGNGRRPKRRWRAVSTLLEDFGKDGQGERIALGDIVRALAHRGHGLLLLLFALPNLVPLYLPGLATIFSLPLAVVSTQMLLGRRQPWLPNAVLDRSLAQRLIGLVCLGLSLLLALPVPFTNIPLALPIALMGLALIARDGLLVMIGSALGAAAAGATLLFGWKALGAAWNFIAGLAA